MHANHLTNTDTEEPTAALKAYWATPEFAAYLAAKKDWEDAHAIYVDPLTVKGNDAFDVLDGTAAEARRTLAICRALPIHKEAFGW